MGLMNIVKKLHFAKAEPAPIVPVAEGEALDKQETKRVPTRLIQSLVNNPLTRSRQALQNFKGSKAYLQEKAKGELVTKAWVPAALIDAVFLGDVTAINVSNSQRGTKYSFTGIQLARLQEKIEQAIGGRVTGSFEAAGLSLNSARDAIENALKSRNPQITGGDDKAVQKEARQAYEYERGMMTESVHMLKMLKPMTTATSLGIKSAVAGSAKQIGVAGLIGLEGLAAGVLLGASVAVALPVAGATLIGAVGVAGVGVAGAALHAAAIGIGAPLVLIAAKAGPPLGMMVKSGLGLRTGKMMRHAVEEQLFRSLTGEKGKVSRSKDVKPFMAEMKAGKSDSELLAGVAQRTAEVDRSAAALEVASKVTAEPSAPAKPAAASQPKTGKKTRAARDLLSKLAKNIGRKSANVSSGKGGLSAPANSFSSIITRQSDEIFSRRSSLDASSTPGTSASQDGSSEPGSPLAEDGSSFAKNVANEQPSATMAVTQE